MPKYYIVDDDSALEGLDDDSKQKFKTYEPEDTSGLKNKANELLQESKSKSATIAELQADLKKANLSPPNKGDNDLEAQLADATSRLKASEDNNGKLQHQITHGKVNTEAQRVAATLTKDTKRAELLAEKISSRLQSNGDGFTILDANGGATISTMDELTSSIKSEYDFLVDGSKASGGSAPGGSGGAVNTDKTVTRSEFDKMDHFARSKHATSGGKVVDDD